MLALAVGCGRSIRSADRDADAGVSPSPDDPLGFSDPPDDVCVCTGDQRPACCETHTSGQWGSCSCGDGVVNGAPDGCADEIYAGRPAMDECDDHDLAGQSCESLGYVSGTLGCRQTCHFDLSGCEDCAVGGPVTACAHPFDRNDDASLLALASKGDELGVALVTGTSTENGYGGETSVRLALLDAELTVKSSVAVPLSYASKLSLSATPDGWLLLVETLNYEGFDSPPNGVIQTLLSFDAAGRLRGSAAFHGRHDGFLVPREGAEPLYAFTTDRGGVSTAWGQVLSYSTEADVAPFVADSWLRSTSTISACGSASDDGVSLYSRYSKPNEEGYVGTLVLPRPKVIGGLAFRATAPGACAYDALGFIYQGRAPDDGSLGTFLRYPILDNPTFLSRDSGPIAAFRTAGFPALGPRELVLRATLADAGPTDLQVWDLRIPAKFVATSVARGPRVPSYDIVRIGETYGQDAIAGWIAQPPSNTELGRVTLARMHPQFP